MLRLRPRDKHRRRHNQIHPPEFLVPGNVLRRLARRPPRQRRIVTCHFVRTKLPLRMRIQIRAIAIQRKHNQQLGIHPRRRNALHPKPLDRRMKGLSQLHALISPRTRDKQGECEQDFWAGPASTNDDKRMPPFRTKPKNREVIVKRRSAINPETLHYRETCPVNQRKVLVAEGESNLPGSFEVRRTDRCDRCSAIPEPFPKSLGSAPMDPPAQKGPSFQQHVVRRH